MIAPKPRRDMLRLAEMIDQANQARIRYEDTCLDLYMHMDWDVLEMLKVGKRRAAQLRAASRLRTATDD